MSELSRRYAKALFELAKQNNCLDEVYHSFKEVSAVIDGNGEFKSFIHNPLFSVQERSRIIERVFGNKFPAILNRFLLFIIIKNRLNIIKDVCESFDQLYLQENNQMRALLEVAFEMQEGQKQDFMQRLERKYNKKVLLDIHLKPELIGGFRFMTAGVLFDASIKSQLEQFKQKLV